MEKLVNNFSGGSLVDLQGHGHSWGSRERGGGRIGGSPGLRLGKFAPRLRGLRAKLRRAGVGAWRHVETVNIAGCVPEENGRCVSIETIHVGFLA